MADPNAAEPELMSVGSASRAFSFLEPFLPPNKLRTGDVDRAYPHLTLTYASSLDGAIASSPGTQTALSGSISKSMTHYLRSRHDAVFVGAGTAIADDPALNCRLQGIGGLDQPRPVILDPHARWTQHMNTKSRVVRNALNDSGKGVWLLYGEETIDQYPEAKRDVIEYGMGRVVPVPLNWNTVGDVVVLWEDVLRKLGQEGIKSVMVEGGARVINDLLSPRYRYLVSSVVVTLAPVFLGKGSLKVSPGLEVEVGETTQDSQRAVSLEDVIWRKLGEDMLMCGKLQPSS